MLAKLERRIAALEASVSQMVRVGEVVSRNEKRGTVKVKLPDSEGLVSKDLPVLFAKTQDDKFYQMPDIGEQLLCLFLPNGLEQGFVLGSFYSDVDGVPLGNIHKWHRKFRDGTTFDYDRQLHELTVKVKGDVFVSADNLARVTAPQIDLIGDVTISGRLDVGGDFTVAGTSELDGDVTTLLTLEVTDNLHSDGNITALGSILPNTPGP